MGVGALFALGGLRALLLALPAATAPDPMAGLAALAAFGAGIFVTMALFGFVVSKLIARLGEENLRRFGPQAVGLASVLVGCSQLILA